MTIAEFIVKLQTFPQDKLIAISDADTGWHGDDITISEYENAVYLRIEYIDMDSRFNYGNLIRED